MQVKERNVEGIGRDRKKIQKPSQQHFFLNFGNTCILTCLVANFSSTVYKTQL